MRQIVSVPGIFALISKWNRFWSTSLKKTFFLWKIYLDVMRRCPGWESSYIPYTWTKTEYFTIHYIALKIIVLKLSIEVGATSNKLNEKVLEKYYSMNGHWIVRYFWQCVVLHKKNFPDSVNVLLLRHYPLTIHILCILQYK